MSGPQEGSQVASDESSQASSGAPRENSNWADVRVSPPFPPSDSTATTLAGSSSVSGGLNPPLTLNPHRWADMGHMTCAFWLRGGCRYDDDKCQYAHHDTGLHADKPRPPTRGYPAMAGNNLTMYESELERRALVASRSSGRSVMSPTAPPFVPGLLAASTSNVHSRPPPFARENSAALGTARRGNAPAFSRGNPPPRSEWGQTVDARFQPGAHTSSPLTGQNSNNNGRPSGRPSGRFGTQRITGPQISRFGGGLGPEFWRGSQGYQGSRGSDTNARANRPGMADVNRGGRGGTDFGNGSSSSNLNPPQDQ